MEQEEKGENANVIEKISAELQKEREKSAELLRRIALLEAQIQQRDNKDSLLITNQKDNYINTSGRKFEKFKKQKVETIGDISYNGKDIECSMSRKPKHNSENTDKNNFNWMSMDSEHAAGFECSVHGQEDDYNRKCQENNDKSSNADKQREKSDFDFEEKIPMPCTERFYGGHSQVTNEDSKKDCMLPDMQSNYNRKDLQKDDKSEMPTEFPASVNESMQKNPSKVPFCPKEVQRMLDSEALSLKNAQSHTVRKILVFGSLGIRHGCEDMYELDFNHFSIFRKGEPYVSAEDPGEHVLYESPGVRRKVFYPNRGNPILCPVRIIEEENAMRPSEPSCPSSLFLCIKYGGRTRKLPQNEYVRQHMGRNKLKSFGPVVCQMAALVHIRSGSFFFKALGITLLFMAGFPENIVQMETKHRNLDLLQKYYRRDEDAEGEVLFLPHPTTSNAQGSPSFELLTSKATRAKSKGKKQAKNTTKLDNPPHSSTQHSVPSGATLTAQYGPMDFNSIQTQTPSDTQAKSNPTGICSGTHISYQNQINPYHVFHRPANSFLPVMYWPTFPPGPYANTYSYQSFPSYFPQQFYSHSSGPLHVEMVKDRTNNDEVDDIDSTSSSSSTKTREA